MSKISEAILTVEDLYIKANKDYNLWSDRIICGGIYSEFNAIAISAAECYGRLSALAEVNYRLLGDEGLMNLLKDVKPRLYRSNYEES